MSVPFAAISDLLPLAGYFVGLRRLSLLCWTEVVVRSPPPSDQQSITSPIILYLKNLPILYH